jgi:hypothetical protein
MQHGGVRRGIHIGFFEFQKEKMHLGRPNVSGRIILK